MQKPKVKKYINDSPISAQSTAESRESVKSRLIIFYDDSPLIDKKKGSLKSDIKTLVNFSLVPM